MLPSIAVAALLLGQFEGTQASVVKVIDGDTVKVAVAGIADQVVVRLLGVDAPERASDHYPGDPWAFQATLVLRRLLPVGTSVRLWGDSGGGTDKDGRVLAWLTIGDAGKPIEFQLLMEGSVRVWTGEGVKRPWAAFLCPIEAGARGKPVGIWKLKRNAKPSLCPK